MPFSENEELSDLEYSSDIFDTLDRRGFFAGRGFDNCISIDGPRTGDVGETAWVCPKIGGCLTLFRAVCLSDSCFFSFVGDGVPDGGGL
jgi:hypothetical protein